MATLGDVKTTAQNVYLNDFNNQKWTSDQLTPFAQEAHRQLQIQLQLNNIPVIKQQTFTTIVPQIPDLQTYPGYVICPNLPNNIIEPIACYEKPTNDTLNSDWEKMVQKSFTPKEEPVNDLVYWSWIGEQIVFLGALQDNQINLEYNGGIPVPVSDSDPIGVINGEAFIAPMLASLACGSVGGEKKEIKCAKIAAIQLELILCTKVMAEQGMVTRRKPYRHGSVPYIVR